jgi:hypothetical protein
MPAIPTTLLPCRAGDWLLITTADGCWGKGPDIAAAKHALRVAGGEASPPYWHVYSCDPGAYLDMGMTFHRADHPVLLIAAFDPPPPKETP